MGTFVASPPWETIPKPDTGWSVDQPVQLYLGSPLRAMFCVLISDHSEIIVCDYKTRIIIVQKAFIHHHTIRFC